MRSPTPTEWSKLVEEFRDSNLLQKEFAAKKDVSINTLRYYLYKQSKKVQTVSNGFVPVTVVASPAPKARAGSEVVVELRSGATMRIPVGTDTRYVAELLAALG